MTEYINVVDTAKLIRKALKETFPDIKFSVVSDSYSMGASIRIRYQDGPNVAQVEAVTDIFEGSYFDGMIDYKGACYAMMNGKRVKFGADFIFVNRDYSDAKIQSVINRFILKFANNYKLDPAAALPTVEDYKNGNLYYKEVPGLNADKDFVRREIGAMLSKSSDRLSINVSKIASEIVNLGTDNYGQSARQLEGSVCDGYPRY